MKGLVFRAREGLIERRDARSASCEDICAELATARRGALRRGRLRHHLAHCPGCSEYLEEVRRQRRMMALILPVMPGTGLKRSVLATVGIGTGAAGGAGGLSVVGGSVLTGTAAKVAAVAVLAGGAAVATERVVDGRQSAPAAAPGAARPAAGPTAGAAPTAAGSEPARAAPVQPETKRPRGRRRPAEAPGAHSRSNSRGKSRSNRGARPPGQVRKQSGAQPPGQLKKRSTTGQRRPARGVPSPSRRAGPKPVKPSRPNMPAKPPEPAKPQRQNPAKP